MATIAVDAMGGDLAPAEIVRGTVEALQFLPDTQFLLVGDREALNEQLRHAGKVEERIRIVHAPHVVSMSEVPVEALKRKPGSSIARAVELVRSGEADALVSAGNTGASVAASYMALGSLRGVRRPGIAVTFHARTQPVVIMDVGANIHCKPEDLFGYAVMASLYAEAVLGIGNPRVGLLNIGEEKGKGNALVQETSKLLQRSDLNFVGNVEGDDIFRGTSDVIICDGFVGNIVLKVSEGLSENLFQVFLEELASSAGQNDAAAVLRDALGRFRKHVDYAEQGGAPLLGINGVCIVCHGRSNAWAVTNALRCAVRMLQVDLNQRIERRLAPKSLLGSEVN